MPDLLTEYRRSIAMSQMDVFIDVLSAWHGQYEDDDRPVTLWWVCRLMPLLGEKLCGVLKVNGTDDVDGIGYMVHGLTYKLVLRSRCGTLQAIQSQCEVVTRRQFREAARLSGVSLPSSHATLFLSEPDHA